MINLLSEMHVYINFFSLAAIFICCYALGMLGGLRVMKHHMKGTIQLVREFRETVLFAQTEVDTQLHELIAMLKKVSDMEKSND
jgi:hypothetical protein